MKSNITREKTFSIAIVLILLVVIVGIICKFKTKTKEVEQTYNEELNNTQQTSVQPKKYIETQDYNGMYSFSLQSENNLGYEFQAAGVILFDGSQCKAKYARTKTEFATEDIECNGTCGLNEEDSSTFYFSLYTSNNDEINTYKCTKTKDGLVCELKSEFDLTGCYNNKLNLILTNGSKDFDSTYLETIQNEKNQKEIREKENKEKEEKEFKENCKSYTFEQIARNPNNFKGTKVKLTGKVIQVMSDKNSTNLRVNITKNNLYYTDTIYVVYNPTENEDKILENDIITVYGTSQGDCSYTTVLGSTVTLPNIKAEYITINN